MSPNRTDILIVGAGPTGLVLAMALAQRGIDFRIIDKLKLRENTSRAAVIHACTLEQLDRIGVADELAARGLHVPRFRIRDRERALIEADFSLLLTERPYALLIPQDETEAVLEARLASLGHRVERGSELIELKLSEAGVEARCRREGAMTSIEARFVVGADGEHSIVRESAGIAYPGSSYGSFLLADVRMEWPFGTSEVTLFFSTEGTLVVAPMSQGRYRVVGQLDQAPSQPTAADVQALIDSRGPLGPATVTDVIWGSRFRVHHKLAQTYASGPVVLVGDAAHVHSPAGGQGMNLGIRDALAASRALHEALTDPTRAQAALDAYSREQRKEAEHVLRMTDRLTHVATLQSRIARSLRNAVISLAGLFPPARAKLARTLAGYR